MGTSSRTGYTLLYILVKGITMQKGRIKALEKELVKTKRELELRLARIEDNIRRPLETDSKERAMQLENQEVVDALGNETRAELRKVSAALARINAGDFGICAECGDDIAQERLLAYPHALKCIDCAELDDEISRLAS